MDKLTKDRRSWNMSRIKSKGTGPELAVRKYLFSVGIRYRVNVRLPGKPDIAIKKTKTAIFVNGCFWHGHSGCKDAGIPKSNIDFWQAKISSNVERDRKNRLELEAYGWRVFTVWECEISKEFDKTMSILISNLRTGY